MKKELIELKKNFNGYIQMKEELEEQRLIFNVCVDCFKKELGVEEIINFGKDGYERAKIFEQQYPILARMDNEIKEKNPNYSLDERKRAVYGLFESEFEEVKTDYICNFVREIVDNYYLYKVCSFETVKQLENDMYEYARYGRQNISDLLGPSKEKVQRVENFMGDIVKPYGEIAKGQLSEAKVATKKIVHKGSKKLVKVLQKVADKTE